MLFGHRANRLLVIGQHGMCMCVCTGCVVFFFFVQVAGYSCSFGCCSLSPSGGLTVFCPGDGAWGGCETAGGRVCMMGTALGTMPSTGGGRPPAGKLTTPEGYLKTRSDGRQTVSHQGTAELVDSLV